MIQMFINILFFIFSYLLCTPAVLRGIFSTGVVPEGGCTSVGEKFYPCREIFNEKLCSYAQKYTLYSVC